MSDSKMSLLRRARPSASYVSSKERLKTLHVLFIGKTGVGKSATINTILNEKVAEARPGSSVTKQCSSWTRKVFGEEIQIIDAPGFVDTKDENVVQEIDQYLLMHSHGIDAFVLVLSASDRPTKEEKSVIEAMKMKFGSDIKNYLLILVTRADELDEDDEDGEDGLKEFLSSFADKCDDVIKQCVRAGRFIGFDNKDGDREVQVKAFVAKVQQITEENKGFFYTPAMFQKIREENDRQERRRLLQLKREQEKRIETARERKQAKEEVQKTKKTESEIISRLQAKRNEAKGELRRQEEQQKHTMRVREDKMKMTEINFQQTKEKERRQRNKIQAQKDEMAKMQTAQERENETLRREIQNLKEKVQRQSSLTSPNFEAAAVFDLFDLLPIILDD